MMERITQFLEATLVPVLRPLFDPLHAAINQLPPPVWRLSICLFIFLGTFWALFLKRDYIMLGSPSQARWRDLRMWIPIIVIPYLIIYWTL